MENQPSEAVRFIRTNGTMLPEYAKSKEMQNVASIKSLVTIYTLLHVHNCLRLVMSYQPDCPKMCPKFKMKSA